MTKPEALTQTNFDRLPALLSRSEFRHWTGLSDEDLSAAVREGLVQTLVIARGRHNKYYRWQVAQFAGLVDSTSRVTLMHSLDRLSEAVARLRRAGKPTVELDYELEQMRKIVLLRGSR